MSIERANTTDAISTDPKTGDVILTLSDHLDWSDNLNHQRMLQEKLNAYLRFVESGELLASYPKARGRHVVLHVIFRFPLDQTAREFLDRVRQVVEEAGIGSKYDLFAASYDN